MSVNFRMYTTNYSENATLTASSENSSFPVENAVNLQRRNKVFRTSSAASAINVVIDCSTSVNPKAFFMCGDKNGRIQLTSGATIKLQANSSNSWGSPPVDLTLTWDNDIISYFNDSGIGAYRYWRIYISDTSNPDGYIEIANFALCDFFDPTRGRVQYPLNQSYIDYSDKSITESGVTLVNQKYTAKKYSFEWSALQKADIEEIEQIYNDVGLSKAFFVVMDKALTFSTDASTHTILARFDSEIEWTYSSIDFFNCSMELIEVI